MQTLRELSVTAGPERKACPSSVALQLSKPSYFLEYDRWIYIIALLLIEDVIWYVRDFPDFNTISQEFRGHSDSSLMRVRLEKLLDD